MKYSSQEARGRSVIGLMGRAIARKRRGRNPRLDLSAGSWLLPPVQALLLRHWFVWPIAATALFLSNGAAADDNDPSTLEQRLKTLESTPEKQVTTRAAVSNARKAIQRVLDARAAGDVAHAVELAALAADWANLGANLLRAIELEKELVTLQDRLTEVEQKRRRTEILIEATVAQRERAREELERLKAEKAKKLLPEGTATKPAPVAAKGKAGKKSTPSEKAAPNSTPGPSAAKGPSTTVTP